MTQVSQAARSIFHLSVNTVSVAECIMLHKQAVLSRTDEMRLILRRHLVIFHTIDTVHLRHIKLSFRPTDAH
jgi:DNA-binding response OmpR family regulator